jgi:hypothetical protein
LDAVDDAATGRKHHRASAQIANLAPVRCCRNCLWSCQSTPAVQAERIVVCPLNDKSQRSLCSHSSVPRDVSGIRINERASRVSLSATSSLEGHDIRATAPGLQRYGDAASAARADEQGTAMLEAIGQGGDKCGGRGLIDRPQPRRLLLSCMVLACRGIVIRPAHFGASNVRRFRDTLRLSACWFYHR